MTAQATAEATSTDLATWAIDGSHSSATFTVRHMMISNVRGEFQALSGTVKFDPEHPEASEIHATVEVATINTRDAKRDAHLKSADFFDVESHPVMEFKSKSVKSVGKGELTLVGDLTIRGTTKEVELHVEGPTEPAKDPWGNTRVGASARTKIKRSEFGMTWNAALEAGGVLVGDEVTIQLDVSLVKQA